MIAENNDLINRKENWIVFIVFLISLWFVPAVTHSIVDHPPEYDELLHVLAARSFADSGQPAIADGLYSRASLYTQLVSAVSSPGKHELVLARLPALVSGALLVALLGAWVTRKAGWVAGFGAAAVLTIMPETPYHSTLVRFYTLHAVLMLAMLIVIYEALEPTKKTGTSLVLFSVAIVAFVSGMHFQALSQVTALGAVAGAVVLMAYDRRASILAMVRRYPWFTFAGVLILSAVGLYLFNILNVIDKLRGVTPAWSVSKADDLFFYIKNFTPRLPLIWPLFPILLLLAWFDNRRLTLFFVTVTLVCLIVSSLASQKATRYIYHFVPAIALLSALGIKAVVQLAADFISRKLTLRSNTSLMIALAVLAICLVNSVEIQRAIKLATGKGTVDKSVPSIEEPDWLMTLPTLTPYLESVETVVASSGVKSLFAYGRYDYELSRTVIDDTLTKEEFGHDPRTGRLVISSAESIAKVIGDPGSELIVLENRMMNKTYSAPAETVDVINDQCSIVEVAPESQLSVWICR